MPRPRCSESEAVAEPRPIVQDHPRGHAQQHGGGGSPGGGSPRAASPLGSERRDASSSTSSGSPVNNRSISINSNSNKLGMVTVFTKEGCLICDAVKDELMIRDIPYQEITLEASENQPVPEFFLNNDPVPGGLEELISLVDHARRQSPDVNNYHNSISSSSNRRRGRTVLQDDSHSYYDPMGNSSAGHHASQRSFYDPMGESHKSNGDSEEDLTAATHALTFTNIHGTEDDNSSKYHESMASITEDLYNDESYNTAYSRERSLPEHRRSFREEYKRSKSASTMIQESHRSLSFEDALDLSSKRHHSSRNLGHHDSSNSHNSSNYDMQHHHHKDLDESNQSLSTDDIAAPLEGFSKVTAAASNNMEDSLPSLLPLGMSSNSRMTTSAMNSSSRLESSVRLTNIRRRMQDSSSTMHYSAPPPAAAHSSAIMQESFNNSLSASIRSVGPPESKLNIELPNKHRRVSNFDAMKELSSILPCSDRKYGMTFYRNCFTGSEAVDALSKHYNLSRPAAKALAIHLHQSTLLHHVVHEHEFEDTSRYFYRLQCYQTPDVINSYCIWTHQETRTKHGKEVIEELHESLQKIFKAIADPKTGKLNYNEAKHQGEKWDELEFHVCELQLVNLARMDKKSLLAFGLNVYQLFWHFGMMKLGIPTTATARSAFQTQVKFNIGGDVYTFSDWWNGILRGNRKSPHGGGTPFKPTKDPRSYLSLPNPVDPRIHFAAAMSLLTRPLKVYTSQNLEKDLQLAAHAFCSLPEFVRLDVNTNTLLLHRCFDDYSCDFGTSSKTLPSTIVPWIPKTTRKGFEDSVAAIGKSLKIVYQKDDDWTRHAGKFEPFDETSAQLKADVKKRFLNKNNSFRKLLLK